MRPLFHALLVAACGDTAAPWVLDWAGDHERVGVDGQLRDRMVHASDLIGPCLRSNWAMPPI